MDRGRYRLPVKRAVAIAILIFPGACGRPGGQDGVSGNALVEAGSQTANTASTAVQPQASPVLSNGLSPAEAQGIAQEVLADLLRRQFSWKGPGWGDEHACTEVFDVGQPQIVDASLSGQAGRVKIAVPITGQRPYRAPEHFNIQWWYPTRYCYGVEDDGRWAVGRTVNVLIEYNVEHWQSGWRLSATQGQS